MDLIPKQEQPTKGLRFRRRWKNFLFYRGVRYMDEASCRLRAVDLASSRGRGGQIANKKQPSTQTSSLPRCFRHDPCATWDVASAAPDVNLNLRRTSPVLRQLSLAARSQRLDGCTPATLPFRSCRISLNWAGYSAYIATCGRRRAARNRAEAGQRRHHSAFACPPG